MVDPKVSYYSLASYSVHIVTSGKNKERRGKEGVAWPIPLGTFGIGYKHDHQRVCLLVLSEPE